MYEYLALFLVGLHFVLLFYLMFGGFLAWWKPWLIVPHTLYLGWALLSFWVAVDCPISEAENWARAMDGQVIDETPFINRYVEGVFYATGHINHLRAAYVAVIVPSWVGAVLWRRRLAGRARERDDRVVA